MENPIRAGIYSVRFTAIVDVVFKDVDGRNLGVTSATGLLNTYPRLRIRVEFATSFSQVA